MSENSNLIRLVNQLQSLPNETEWLEFKASNFDCRMIAEDISALANSAALAERPCAYMIWGISDESREIIGTNLTRFSKLKCNQELDSWLRNMLSSGAEYEFLECSIDEKPIIILRISQAISQPVTFEKKAYIRVGSYTMKLADYPGIEAKLWDRLRLKNFELIPAKTDLTEQEVLSLLDYASYFRLLGQTIPSANRVCHYLLEDQLIRHQDNGLYYISNLGALLLSHRLSDFGKLSRKMPRVVQYETASRVSMLKEESFDMGYALSFESVLQYIEALTPSTEPIIGAYRKKLSAFPAIAIRELVANMLIHQDFTLTGTGPTVEIFPNRVEITNPGTPLIDKFRIIDNPPKSRNEQLASLMRRVQICEELGTGWDKIVYACEQTQIPAPRIDIHEFATKITLFSRQTFGSLSVDERLWTAYLHTCLLHTEGEYMTNSSLRLRFGVSSGSAASISRLIKDLLEIKWIKPLDPNTAPRYMKYVPYWS